MNFKQEHDLTECTEYRQTLLARPPRVVRGTVILLMAFIAAAVLWATLTKADLVVRAAGRVRPMSHSAQLPDSAAEESEVSPLRGGRVIEVHVREGELVKTGDLLFRLETEQLDNEIAKQQQRIQAAESELRSLDQTERMIEQRFQTAKSKAEAEIAEAQEALKTAERRRSSAIGLAEVELELAENELRRLRKLVSSRAVTAAEVLHAEGRYREAKLKLLQAELPIEEGRRLVLGHALRLVEKEYAVERTELDARRKLKSSEAAAARLELAKLNWERRQSELRAPSDGTVCALDVKVGDVVEPGQAALSVVEQRGYRIDVTVTSEDIGQLREGMQARVKFDAYEYQKYGSLTGHVVFVSPDSALRTDEKAPGPPVYTVRIAIDGEHVGRGGQRGDIKLGMTGVAEIITDQESILSLLVRSIRQSVSLG